MESPQSPDPQGQMNNYSNNNSNKTRIIIVDLIIGAILIGGGYLYVNRETLMPSTPKEPTTQVADTSEPQKPKTLNPQEQKCSDKATEFLNYVKEENISKAYEVSSPYFKESETAQSFQEFIDYNNFLIEMKDFKFDDIKIDREYCDVYGFVYPAEDNVSPIYLELVNDVDTKEFGVSHVNFYSKERNVNEIQAIELCHSFFDYMYDKDFDGAYSMLSSDYKKKYTKSDLQKLSEDYPIFVDNNTSNVTIDDYSEDYIETTAVLSFEEEDLSMDFELVKEDSYFKISYLSLLK